MRNNVDLPTLQALHEEWREHPPVHHLVAAYLDYKPAGHGAGMSPEQEQQLASMMSNMPTSGGASHALDTSAWDACQKKDDRNG